MTFTRNLSLLLFVFFSTASGQTENHVVVSEVAPMGGGSTVFNSGEFIELYNPTSVDVTFGPSVTIVSGNTSGSNNAEWQISLAGVTVKAFGFLLIGDAGTNGRDLSFPSGKNLSNSGIRSCVQLRDGIVVVDAFGWDPATTPTLTAEGARFLPSNPSSTHKSFERKSSSSAIGSDSLGNGYDTDNNATDFFENDSAHSNPQNTTSPIEAPFSGADTTAPFLLSMSVQSSSSLFVQFNEPLDSATAVQIVHYSISGGTNVLGVVAQTNPSQIVITTTAMAPGLYSLTISGLQDRSGNVMVQPIVVHFSSGAIGIAQARSLGAGSAVRIRGIVTVGGEFAIPSYIQDPTGALAIFNNAFGLRAKQGDQWEIAGTLRNFSGQLQVDPLTDSVLISSGNPFVVPTKVNSAALIDSNEARLVRIDNVKFISTGSFGVGADSSYVVADVNGPFIIRIDKDTNIPGSPIPTDSVNLVGVVNEFNGSYRLMPRSFADIGVSDPVPGQTWMDISVVRGFAVGAAVRIRGIVTYSQPGSTNTIFMQDATGGMALYSTASNGLVVGDSVEVRGAMDIFSNLQEVKNIDSVWSFGSGHPLPDPRELLVTQASEAVEGVLVRFRNVRFLQAGTFAGNTTYQVTDGVNQLDVRIPTGSALDGAAIPPGAIDASGVLGQYLTKYQLIPRTPADLVALPGPQITAAPVIDSLFDSGFRVTWSTLTPGNSKIFYGLGESITDSIIVATEQTAHSVTVSGLQSGLVYVYRVASVNASGESEAGTSYAVTTSSASTGQIRVVFNYPVDTALPLAEQAEGNVDLGALILSRISAATRSIDLALYSFDDFSGTATDIAQRVADSLTAAKNRGVKVRMIYHDRASSTPLNTLINAGIPVLKRTVFSSSSGMHNKFWIFDGRDEVSATDDWVVTGSWNVTDEGTYRDAQNTVLFQDRSLAAIYTKEFEEMFGSTTEVPNPTNARFGPTKRDDTPHWTMVGGTKVEVYFSPSDRTSSAIARAINTTQYNAFFGLFSFTRDEIANALIARKNAGAIVRGIIDNTGDTGTEYTFLQSSGVDVLSAGHGVVVGAFHHKYGIVDPYHDWSDPLVITGSHNWSSSAESDNDENTVIIHSGSVARQFVREFSKRYTESGGTGPVTGAGDRALIPTTLRLDAPWPNPFNPSTTIRFAVPTESKVQLRIVDMLGRTVQEILNETLPAGERTAIWNASSVASGIYVVVLDAGSTRLTRKLVLVK